MLDLRGLHEQSELGAAPEDVIHLGGPLLAPQVVDFLRVHLLAEILAAHVDRPDVDVRLLARIMTATFRSLKEVAVDTADLRRMIDLEITVIVAALRKFAGLMPPSS